MKNFIGRILSGARPEQAVVSWLKELSKLANVPVISFVKIMKNRPGHEPQEGWLERARAQFFNSIELALKEGKVVSANLDSDIGGSRHYQINGIGQSLSSYIELFQSNAPVELTLSNLSIKELNVLNPVKLKLENCSVAKLYVAQSAKDSEVRMTQSMIGKLQVTPGTLKHYEMRGGCLLDIGCPPPNGGNPFTGTVSLSGVFLPRTRNQYVLSGPQPYRNIRHHLRGLENSQMANLFYSAELAVEREDDTWTNRALSYFYEWASDFGSSALRPILWQLLLICISVLLILYSDGSVYVATESSSKIVSWQNIFTENTTSAEYTRAFYLALQPLVNPLGIFGHKSLLIPRYPWLALWLTVQGFLAFIFLALLVFAIRRRFKIQ